ncbi:redoxin domain-containing protein [Candidatus Micrarchaeota archaeon]|nr:redoxin domain-containing protein [Candidatus Micrarchaeota archaeon]
MIAFPKPIALLVAVVLIVSAVFIIESGKVHSGSGAALNANPTVTSSTPLFSPSVSSSSPSKAGLKKAPELAGITGYLNAPDGFKLADAKGKVILVDFWTYTCINCIRTLPYLTDWYSKYAAQGFEIIGVHTPEFEFEKDINNVRAAVEKYGIKYPVVLDSIYGTWNAYQNQYWPHHFLIDADGYIRFDHIGEGGYDETEAQIVQLLKERNASITMNTTAPAVTPTDFSKIGTPEIYFGAKFIRQPLGNDQTLAADVPINFTFPKTAFTPNLAYLDGTWALRAGSAELLSETGRVALVFTANKANIVAGTNVNQTVWLNASVDGKALSEETAGSDAVLAGSGFTVPVMDQRLYNIVSTKGYRQKELMFNVTKGFELYTFTFG